MAAARAIPDKPYFRIGEVADIVGVKASVLRYWETEFKSVKPEKTKTNQRVYSRKDVERLVAIRSLLYDQGFTIAGARKKLREPAPLDHAAAGDGASDGAAAEPGPASGAQAARVRKAVDKAIAETKEILRLCDEWAI